MRDKRVIKAITMITQIGISMMVPIFLCIFIGYELDRKFHTNAWFLIWLVLGIITSFRNVYYLTKSFYAKDKAREDEEMNYFQNLRQNNGDYKTSTIRGTSKRVK